MCVFALQDDVSYEPNVYWCQKKKSVNNGPVYFLGFNKNMFKTKKHKHFISNSKLKTLKFANVTNVYIKAVFSFQTLKYL